MRGDQGGGVSGGGVGREEVHEVGSGRRCMRGDQGGGVGREEVHEVGSGRRCMRWDQGGGA